VRFVRRFNGIFCNTEMGETYLGRMLSNELVLELQQLGIDPCGENGVSLLWLLIVLYFSLQPIVLPQYEKKHFDSYCFLVWEEVSIITNQAPFKMKKDTNLRQK
jgi:diphthamide synthase (EF-2-diphthine--ammonia ligase)